MATKVGFVLFGLCLIALVSAMMFTGGDDADGEGVAGTEPAPKAGAPLGKEPVDAPKRTSQTRKVEELDRKLENVRLEKSVAAKEVDTATLEMGNAETRVQQARLPVQQAESDLILATRQYEAEYAAFEASRNYANQMSGYAGAFGIERPDPGQPPNQFGVMQAREKLAQTRQRCSLEIDNAERGLTQTSNRLAQAQQRYKKAENDERLILLEIEKVSHGD